MLTPTLLICLTVFSLSLWKVYLGAVISNIIGFNYLQMLLLNLSAVSMSSILTIFLGQRISDLLVRKKKGGYNKNLKKVLILWRRYGFWSAVTLAPVLLGVPTYILIGLRLKESKLSLLSSILISSTIWLSVCYFLMDVWDFSSYLDVEKYLTFA
ncbi:hypothetical protein [Flammeovirga sp. SJP92]|uniref:hypothetical protein n=1 Tax=Flammeovirga sp. SJP92 TaxID=1775430 RepID=UPI000787DF92|nr:hypothetical protein [Flammeovirga sp. SJP92]KXX72289.1 hypothetical protein AVL50_01420 [Flammeovirga sp. SJP92]